MIVHDLHVKMWSFFRARQADFLAAVRLLRHLLMMLEDLLPVNIEFADLTILHIPALHLHDRI